MSNISVTKRAVVSVLIAAVLCLVAAASLVAAPESGETSGANSAGKTKGEAAKGVGETMSGETGVDIFAQSLTGSSPLHSKRQKPEATLHIPEHIAVNQAVPFRFDLDGYQIPAGSYTSINISVLKRPEGEKPAVRSGYPETVIRFYQSGTYLLRFVLNEIRKPSCGGVEASEFLNMERTVIVE